MLNLCKYYVDKTCSEKVIPLINEMLTDKYYVDKTCSEKVLPLINEMLTDRLVSPESEGYVLKLNKA